MYETFSCVRLPIPRPGEVLGLVGTNGIGKSTALKILAGKQKPNLGKYDVSHISHTPTHTHHHILWTKRQSVVLPQLGYFGKNTKKI